jgi:hypothetical protein
MTRPLHSQSLCADADDRSIKKGQPNALPHAQGLDKLPQTYHRLIRQKPYMESGPLRDLRIRLPTNDDDRIPNSVSADDPVQTSTSSVRRKGRSLMQYFVK